MAEKRSQDIPSNSLGERREFHIVGVGASAGGLEALESFFQNVPVDSGMAFVVVQHLSPDFKSHMDELLRRRTEIPVHLVKDGMEVLPNTVYLLPARMEMVISGGKLLLTERDPERGFSHPIDQFFRSLAHDQGDRGIAIVLSGTGSDGSRGVRDVHEAGGLTISQDEGSARFGGMPISAQATGIIDLVLPPEAMAEALLKFTKHGICRADLNPPMPRLIGIDKLFQDLNKRFGVDFSNYKEATVGRRVRRRMERLKMSEVDDYVNYVASQPEELTELHRDLLICVTRFFRDPDAFGSLAKNTIVKIFDRTPSGQTVRVWVAGCSTGEEAYSLAILLDEEKRRRNANVHIKVFATDVHPGAIQIAARGLYSLESMASISEERREFYFRRDSTGYQVSQRLRQFIVFAPHNILNDAPFTQMDLVTCRNLLIYLQPESQAKALSLFHFALKSGGTLFLGPSESLGELSDEFQVADAHWRIFFKRRDVRMPIRTLPNPSTNVRVPLFPHGPALKRQKESPMGDDTLGIYDELLTHKIGSGILVDRRGNVRHVFGDATKYLRYATGRPSIHLLDAIHESIRSPLSAAIIQADRKREKVQVAKVPFPGGVSDDLLQIVVEPIGDPVSGLGNLLIAISSIKHDENEGNLVPEVPSPETYSEEYSGQVGYLRSELQQTQENLQATIEEMETSNEELQASNEELVASNEELQSTNEELHSVNEELYTVNAEYQRRVVELAQANADMENLLVTTRVGVIFLDENLRIRRFTPQIADLLALDDKDLGRPIVDFSHRIGRSHLSDDLRQVLRSNQPVEARVKDAAGISFLMRIVPYRNGNDVNGIVLTLIDIESLATAEAQMERFKFMTEASTEMIFLADTTNQFQYVNPAMCKLLGYGKEELQQMGLTDIELDLAPTEFDSRLVKVRDEVLQPFESEWKTKDGTVFPVELSQSYVKIEDTEYLCGSVREITQRRKAEQEMRLQQLAIESTHNGIIITDATRSDHPIQYANPGFLALTQYERDEVVGINCRFLQGPATDSSAIDTLRSAIQAGTPCRIALQNYRKDGSPFWNDLQITPVFDRRGKLVNYVGVQNDITERMQIQFALEFANKEVKAASDAKSSFMANMSHELRTPMTAVIGFADMLAAELQDTPHLEKISTIKRNGEYLLTLLNDILDLSKIEAGQLEIQAHTLNLRELISEVQLLMEVRAMEEGIPLSFIWKSDAPAEVTADETRVRQVLVNLIGNALKFTNQGEVRVEIGTDREVSPPRLNISVCDTGIGIHESHLAELFTPFSQSGVSRRSRFGGTGLGLSISKRLAEGMGGSISVKSRLGIGSSFTFSLPLSEQQANNKEVSPPKMRRVKESTQHQEFPKLQARVLLADDRRDIWRIGKYYLEKSGANVTVVEDGLQAVEEAQRADKEGRPFDLILMDMQMPVMTGKEAIGEIRQLGFQMPIIALTADAMQGEREACIEMGCDDYFPKPIDGIRLLQLIEHHLKKR